jgi:GNAT superfamily N-acetyltransferase
MTETPVFTIMPIEAADSAFLKTAMYHAIFVPPGSPDHPEDIVDTPEIARYWRDWGRPGDLGVMARHVDTNTPLGAAWLRLFHETEKGYGFISPEIPEMSVSVIPGMRSRGIGTALVSALLAGADDLFDAVSLSVDEINPAVSLYSRFGFVRHHLDGDSITMIRGKP